VVQGGRNGAGAQKHSNPYVVKVVVRGGESTEKDSQVGNLVQKVVGAEVVHGGWDGAHALKDKRSLFEKLVRNGAGAEVVQGRLRAHKDLHSQIGKVVQNKAWAELRCVVGAGVVRGTANAQAHVVALAQEAENSHSIAHRQAVEEVGAWAERTCAEGAWAEGAWADLLDTRHAVPQRCAGGACVETAWADLPDTHHAALGHVCADLLDTHHAAAAVVVVKTYAAPWDLNTLPIRRTAGKLQPELSSETADASSPLHLESRAVCCLWRSSWHR